MGMAANPLNSGVAQTAPRLGNVLALPQGSAPRQKPRHASPNLVSGRKDRRSRVRAGADGESGVTGGKGVGPPATHSGNAGGAAAGAGASALRSAAAAAAKPRRKGSVARASAVGPAAAGGNAAVMAAALVGLPTAERVPEEAERSPQNRARDGQPAMKNGLNPREGGRLLDAEARLAALAASVTGEDAEEDLRLYNALLRSTLPPPPQASTASAVPPLALLPEVQEGPGAPPGDLGTLRFSQLSDVVSTVDSATKVETERAFRERRLATALGVLEGLERRGNLNMDQVYHRRFLLECKEASAVALAHRFVQLIVKSNPAGPAAPEKNTAARARAARTCLQAFTLLMSVCAHCGDGKGALQAMKLARENGVAPDTALYTALITALCRASQLDLAFKFFYEMESQGIAANSHTICSLIDGCGKAHLIAKAFGVYGLMQSRNVRADRAVYNALITACVRAGATERAFDILEDMQQEDPALGADCVTAGALLSASFSNPLQKDRALQLYRGQLAQLQGQHIATAAPGEANLAVLQADASAAGECGWTGGASSKGWLPREGSSCAHPLPMADPLRMLTAAVHACSGVGDWEQALQIYEDLKALPYVRPDEVFASAMLDVARHAGRPEEGEAVLEELELQMGMKMGPAVVNSLMSLYAQMGLKDRALMVYQKVQAEAQAAGRTDTLKGPAFNALISLLCSQGALAEALEVAADMKSSCSCGGPDMSTYTLLLEACLRNEALPAPLPPLQAEAKAKVEGSSTAEAWPSASGSQLAQENILPRLPPEVDREPSPPPTSETFRHSGQGTEDAGSAETGAGGLLALQLYQMARQENVRIGLRLCELMIDICREMQAKGAPDPPRALVEALRLQHPGTLPSGLAAPAAGVGTTGACGAPGLTLSASGALWQQQQQDMDSPTGTFLRRQSLGLSPGLRARHRGSSGMRFWPMSREEAQVQQQPRRHGGGHQQQQDEGSAFGVAEAERNSFAIGSALFPITGWRLVAVTVYEHSVQSGVVPTLNVLSKVLGLLRKAAPTSPAATQISPVPLPTLAFHPLAFVLCQEAERLGALPTLSSPVGPLTLRLEAFPSHLAEAYLLLILSRLQARLTAAPGLMLFPLSIHLAVASQDLVLRKATALPQAQLQQHSKGGQPRRRVGRKNSPGGAAKDEAPRKQAPHVRQIQLACRTGHSVASLLRRLRLPFIGSESSGVLRVTASALTSWLRSMPPGADVGWRHLPPMVDSLETGPCQETEERPSSVDADPLVASSTAVGKNVQIHMDGVGPLGEVSLAKETAQQMLSRESLSRQVRRIRSIGL